MNLPEPLDPASPKGRKVAADLSVVLTDVRRAIAARKARDAVRRGREEPPMTD